MSLSLNYPTISPSLLLDFANSGRLDPQVTFTRSSTATFFDASGTLQSAANDVPRFDYNPATLAAQGLLIEESRTNSITNNTMVGAVAGTPGTAPTNWQVTTTGDGITREIIGTGTENGLTYIDIKYSGTPLSTSNLAISFELINQVAASSGQAWTESAYIKLQAGSFSGTTTTLSLLGTNGSSGLENFQTAAIASTPANLRECRLSVAGTFTNAGTTHAQPRVRIGYTVGVAIDFTLRIGLPQLELGAFATSVIPTTTTALTRAADVASVNTLSPWFNASEGTLYVQASVGSAAATAIRLAAIDDGTTGNVIRFASGTVSFQVLLSNAVQANLVVVSLVDNIPAKIAGAYKLNDFAASANGGAALTDTAGTIPVVDRLVLGAASGVSPKQTWIQRFTYYPVRLPNAQLQAITV
jgi:hypothetical protein